MGALEISRRECLALGLGGLSMLAGGGPVMGALSAGALARVIGAEVAWDERGRWTSSGEEPFRLWRRGCWLEARSEGLMFCHAAVPLDAEVTWDFGREGSVRHALLERDGRAAGPRKRREDLWQFIVDLRRDVTIVRARFESGDIIVSQADHGEEGAMALAVLLTRGFGVEHQPRLRRF